MDERLIRNILGQQVITINPSEFQVLLEFVKFLKDRSYGEFVAVINTNPKTKQKDILINIVNKKKIELKNSD